MAGIFCLMVLSKKVRVKKIGDVKANKEDFWHL